MTLVRSTHFTSDIIADVAAYVIKQQLERGSLLTASTPIAFVVFDVLKAIGIPDTAIALAFKGCQDWELQKELFSIWTAENGIFEPCACCENMGRHLVKTRQGWVFGCDACANEAKSIGMEVL